jgi:hypothetical protein
LAKILLAKLPDGALAWFVRSERDIFVVGANGREGKNDSSKRAPRPISHCARDVCGALVVLTVGRLHSHDLDENARIANDLRRSDR